MRSAWVYTLALSLLVVWLAGCVPTERIPTAAPVTITPSVPQLTTPSSPPTPENTKTSRGGSVTSAVLVDVVDGDTIETSVGRVRIVGIDSPERGECGFTQATEALQKLILPGDHLTLELPVGQNDTDRYGRLIRYVYTPTGLDVGFTQLESGQAIARYDSRDGYPKHPFEADYHAAQIATRAADGSVVTTACAGAAPPAAVGPPEDAWWTQYSSCTKLKQNTLGHPTGPFDRDDPEQAEIYNWFAHGTGNNGDGDGDGLACEGGRR